MKNVTILIPTYNRVTALSTTLTSLNYQNYYNFDIVVSDQSDEYSISENPTIKTLQRIFKLKDINLFVYKNLPKRGIAQQRQFLLDHSSTKYILYLDDDLILEDYVIEGLVKAIKEEECGFVGRPVIGLSFLRDIRSDQQNIEFWNEKVQSEKILPNSPKWQRYYLHNAANPYHIQKKLNIEWPSQRKYKIAWIGGCVLYDTSKLKDVGGFEFWKKLPKEKVVGEDVMAELNVMSKYGGCGVLPSGVYHQELKTTIERRDINVPEILSFKNKA